MNPSADAITLFLQNFTARNLAVALPSLDDVASAPAILETMDQRLCDVVGIRHQGLVTGWLARIDVVAGQPLPPLREFSQELVIDEQSPLHKVVQALQTAPCLFVQSWGQVSGILRRSDLDKPAALMWLFGLVTVTEQRVTRYIDEACPQDSWQQYLSPARLQKALDLQAERRRLGQERSLLECLQLADKGRIVAKDPALRERTQFTSLRQVEVFVKALEVLRNNLAHSQDIAGDWDFTFTLATNLERVVLGPRPN